MFYSFREIKELLNSRKHLFFFENCQIASEDEKAIRNVKPEGMVDGWYFRNLLKRDLAPPQVHRGRDLFSWGKRSRKLSSLGEGNKLRFGDHSCTFELYFSSATSQL